VTLLHADMTDGQSTVRSARRRWLPAAVLMAAVAAIYLSGLYRYLSFAAFLDRSAAIEAFVASHLIVAVAAFALVYIVIVALSLPGSAIMSVIGGFLFGWTISAPVTLVAATIGAVIVFEAIRTSFGAVLAERAGPMARKMSDGFCCNAFHYLLFLRLMPVFPFFAVNAVAGLCRVPLRTFVAATVIGIIPGCLVFAYLGAGLGGVIEAQAEAHADCVAKNGPEACVMTVDPSHLLTPQIAVAFVALALLALLPVAVKRWRRNPRLG